MKPLVSTEWLGEFLHDESIRVLDCRFTLADPAKGHADYAEAHIPTASFVSLEEDLAAATGPGRHPLPSPDAFVETLRQLGIGNDHTVVIYDDGSNTAAARLWWMMQSLGHKNVAVLDGGWNRWITEPRSTTKEVPGSEPAELQLGSEWSGTIDFEGITAAQDILLVDSRAPERYRGDEELIDPVAGHIPGAINLYYAGNSDESGMLQDIKLVQRLNELPTDRPVVFYCGSGVTACNNILAAHITGRTDTLLYPGSWSDWSARSDQVASGEG